MKSFTLIAVLAGMTSSCLAGDRRAELVRAIHRSYEQERSLLEHDLRTERSLLKTNYLHQRDVLSAERDQIGRIDCHQTRAHRMRANGRRLAELNKAWARENQQLSRVYQAERSALQEAFLADIRDAHTSASRLRSPMRRHEPGCACADCLAYGTPLVHDYGQSPVKFDWASLVVGLLQSRFGR
jgi:hypothetical protein